MSHEQPARRVADTELGDSLRAEIGALERLIETYRQNLLLEAR